MPTETNAEKNSAARLSIHLQEPSTVPPPCSQCFWARRTRFSFHCCFTAIETVRTRTIMDGEPRTSTSSFTNTAPELCDTSSVRFLFKSLFNQHQLALSPARSSQRRYSYLPPFVQSPSNQPVQSHSCMNRTAAVLKWEELKSFRVSARPVFSL